MDSIIEVNLAWEYPTRYSLNKYVAVDIKIKYESGKNVNIYGEQLGYIKMLDPDYLLPEPILLNDFLYIQNKGHMLLIRIINKSITYN